MTVQTRKELSQMKFTFTEKKMEPSDNLRAYTEKKASKIDRFFQTESEAQGGLNTPMRRSADGREVANAIVFLASREASYITGEALVVDGGNTIQEYKGDSKYYY